MEPTIAAALEQGGIVDITTTGRRTGEAHRIEIFLHNIDGRLFLTGRPGRQRDWIANLAEHPEMTIHLKRGISADVAATASVVTDPVEKAEIIRRARVESWGVDPEEVRADRDVWVASAPLARLDLL